MPEFIDGLRAVAQDYPFLMGTIAVVLVAGLVVALDDLRRSLKSHDYSEQKTLEARQAAANRRELDRQIRAAQRGHQGH